MSKLSIKHLVSAATISLVMIIPAPALAAINPNAQSAAAEGIQYLGNNQNPDGGISGYGGESEWSVEAVQAAGQQASAFEHGGASLLDFVQGDVPGASTPTTAIERNIIAIAAAGQNPANFGGVNYEALLEAQHLSGQIGDPTLLNDDIFGIIAIDAAHDTALLSEAQDALSYLLAHQGADGGFSYTTDTSAGSDNNDTAAAIIAMYAANNLGLGSTSLDAAQSKALVYLLSTQQADGGFGYDDYSPSDGDSTAWSLMALNTIGASVASSASSARAWLLQDQNPDGGFSYGAYGTTASDTYTTANAVIALLGTTWLLSPAPTPIAAASGSAPARPQTVDSTPAPPPAVSPQPQPTGFTADGQPSPAAVQTDSPPAGAPQVKGASTITPSHDKTASTTIAHVSHPRPYDIYFAAILGIIAIMWFAVESRKARRGNI